MSALDSIQISTTALREKLNGDDRAASGDGKAFLKALLDSDFADDGKITGKELVQFLKGRDGKDLPALGELLPLMVGSGEDADSGVSLPQLPATGKDDDDNDPEQVVAGLLAMIQGAENTGSGVDVSATVDDLLAGGASNGRTAAQVREALLQGMAAQADASHKADLKGETFQAALQRFDGAGLPTGAAQPSGESAAKAVPNLQIQTPPGQPGWGNAVGDRLVWMARQDVQQARIHLNPPGMGPLEVSVHMHDDKTSINFTAHHAITREALHTELPKLRAMLADNGFDAVDVNVAQDNGGDRYRDRDFQAGAGGSGGGFGDDDGVIGDTEMSVRHVPAGVGLVDHYA